MNNRPPDSTKKIAIQLANAIAQKAPGYKDLLTQFRQGRQELAATAPVGDMLNQDEHIGIWKKTAGAKDDVYYRDLSLQKEWSLWNGVNSISAGGKKKRIVFLGESVARGYLYDPNYTPAGVLNTLLDNSGCMQAEVIDLAKTNMKLDELGITVRQAAKLRPDAMIIFAGNNWDTTAMHSFTGEEIGGIIKRISQKGHYILKEILEDKISELILDLLAEIPDLYGKAGIPVFFVLPEYNLLDWQSCAQEHVMINLPKKEMIDFIEARQGASHAWDNNDPETAKAHSENMIRIDPSHPEGFENMAKYMIQMDRFAE